MSARRTLRRLLPLLLLALLGALVARQRATRKAAPRREGPLLLPPVEAAVEAITEEIHLGELIAEAAEPAPVERGLIIAEAAEPAPVERDLIVAEAVPEQQINVVAVPPQEPAAVPPENPAVHMITVVDDLLSGRSAEESATISR